MYIPLANAGPPVSFENVQMDMVVVIVVSAWSQHRRKSMTGGNSHFITVNVATTRHDQGTDIDGIAFAVFAKFGVGNAITATALV